MQFQEYPKALYLAGAVLLVDDEHAEDAARADGYDDWHADHERTIAPADASDEPGLNRDALKARATELNVAFATNIKTDKLAALVAAAEK